MPAAIIKAGSLVMTGAQTVIPLGCPADAVWLYLDAGATAKEPVNWTQTAWCQRAQRIGTNDSITNVATVVDGDLVIGTDALCNVAGATLHWVAVCDNGAGLLRTTGWMGSPAAWAPTVGLNGGVAPAALIVERDASRAPCWWSSDLAAPGSILMDGTGVVADAITAMNADGTVSLGTRNNVNELTGGALGEGHDSIAFWQAPGLVQLVTWTGNGTANRTVPHAIANAAFAIIVSGQATAKAGFKWATMGTKMANASSAVLFDNAVTSISGGITLGTDTRYNAAGQSYRAIVIGTQAGSYAADTIAGTGKAIFIRESGTGSISCGTDASLSMAGAFSLEWWGRVLPRNSSGHNILMARSAGPEGRADSDGLANAAGTRLDGTWSWSLGYSRINDIADWAGPMFVVATTNYNNITDFSGSESDVRTKPWRTGILVPRGWFHVVATHDGAGRWNLYLNGRLVKQRKIDMTGVTRADDAGTRVNAGAGSGHRTVIGARYDGSAVGQIARSAFRGASIYGSALTQAQVAQLYRRNFLRDLTSADVAPVERWLAEDAVGTSLPARVNPANNGTMTSAVQVDERLMG